MEFSKDVLLNDDLETDGEVSGIFDQGAIHFQTYDRPRKDTHNTTDSGVSSVSILESCDNSNLDDDICISSDSDKSEEGSGKASSEETASLESDLSDLDLGENEENDTIYLPPSPSPLDKALVSGELTEEDKDLFFAQDEDGDTTLHTSIIGLDLQICAVLIQLPVPARFLDITNSLFQTPLMLAVHTGQTEIVEMLVGKGASLNIRDAQCRNAFHIACQNGNLHILRILLKRTCARSAVLEVRDGIGDTCLHIAVKLGNQEMVKCLISKEIDINAKDVKTGRTALHYAVECGDQLMTTLLFNQPGIKIDCNAYDGITPIILAYVLGHNSIVELFKTKSKLNLKTCRKYTGIENAAK